MAWMYESGRSGDDGDDTDDAWKDEDADGDDANANAAKHANCDCGGHAPGNGHDVVADDDDSGEDLSLIHI